MAGSSATTEKSFHVRSVSLPSRTHPTTLRVQEELHRLKACVESSASSMTKEMICSGLRHLADLYDGSEDLLHLPSIQQGLLHSDQTKRLEEDVDGSMRLLDLCGAMKDAVTASKEHAQDLQLSLRRRGDSSTGEVVQAYVRSRKEAQKTIKKSYKDLKQMDGKCQSVSVIPEDSDLSVILKLLNEARAIARSLLRSILHLMFELKTKARWWSFASKAIRVACEEDSCEIWSIDVSLCAALKDADAEKVVMVKNQMKTIENSFGELENCLECLFRRLIQNRVSLLNILSL